MGRNDRAGYQVWSAADGYPGDGCFREFHRKDANSGMQYWRVTSSTTDLGDKMLYDPVLAMSKVNENSDHYTTLIYHLLNDYKNAAAVILSTSGVYVANFLITCLINSTPSNHQCPNNSVSNDTITKPFSPAAFL